MAKFFNVLILVFTFISCSSSNKDDLSLNEKKSNHYFQRGTEALQKGNFPAAIKNLQSAISLNPEDPRYYNNLGLCYLIKERTQKAIVEFENALRVDRNFHKAKLNLATIYMNNNQEPKAEKIYNRLLNILTFDEHFRVYYNLGALYEKRGDIDKAIEYYQSAISEASGFCIAKIHLAKAYRKKKDMDMAYKAHKDSIRGTCYNSPEVHYELGKIQQELGLYEEAMESYLNIQGRFQSSDWARLAKLRISEMKELTEVSFNSKYLDNSSYNGRKKLENKKTKTE